MIPGLVEEVAQAAKFIGFQEAYKGCEVYMKLHKTNQGRYYKFGNFCVTFISRIFDIRIISEFLKSRMGTCTFYKAYCNPLLARTLFSQCNIFANISEN